MVDIAIDLGTANTLVLVRGEGIVLNEPSVVAVEKATGRVLAAGLEAKRMLGRTPSAIVAVRPVQGGVIADVDRVDLLLRHFMELAAPRRRLRFRPRVVVCVPSGITEMERRAVRAGVLAAGARSVVMIAQPIAAAIGAGMPVVSPTGSMVVDVGGGTTEIAVIALSGIVAENSLRIAGNAFDDAITGFVRRTHNFLIGEATAETLKIRLGSACPLVPEQSMEVRGRALVSGIPTTLTLTSGDIRECLSELVRSIVAAVRRTLEVTPPELASDIAESGLVLTGGGALLAGLAEVLAHETRLPVRVDDDPMTSVVRGAGLVMDDWHLYRDAVAA